MSDRHDKQLIDPRTAERLRHHDTAELADAREQRDRAELATRVPALALRCQPIGKGRLGALGAWICVATAGLILTATVGRVLWAVIFG